MANTPIDLTRVRIARVEFNSRLLLQLAKHPAGDIESLLAAVRAELDAEAAEAAVNNPE